MRKLSFSFLLLSLCACQTQVTLNQLDPSTKVLAQSSTLYVAVPSKPGHDNERVYQGSEYKTAEACMNSLRKYASVKLGRAPEDLKSALASAADAKADYLVKPEIRSWERNPTEWNGERDVVDIDVEVLDVHTGATVSRVALKGKGTTATLGGHQPEDMLVRYFDDYAGQLFGVTNATKDAKPARGR